MPSHQRQPHDPDRGDAYVGRMPCGCPGFLAMVPTPGTPSGRTTSREILRLLRAGWTVTTMPVVEARKLPFRYPCPHQKPQSESESEVPHGQAP